MDIAKKSPGNYYSHYKSYSYNGRSKAIINQLNKDHHVTLIKLFFILIFVLNL
jgi:hypothetical protein